DTRNTPDLPVEDTRPAGPGVLDAERTPARFSGGPDGVEVAEEHRGACAPGAETASAPCDRVAAPAERRPQDVAGPLLPDDVDAGVRGPQLFGEQRRDPVHPSLVRCR